VDCCGNAPSVPGAWCVTDSQQCWRQENPCSVMVFCAAGKLVNNQKNLD
jgi:hypothetical protein